jgi:hypothetical protein
MRIKRCIMGRKVQMLQRTCILSVFTLSMAMASGAVAIAADLPKEGTFSVDYTGFGTSKLTAIGKERALITFDENALWLGKGFGDHMTSHSFGMEDITNGMAQIRGYAVGTDPTGDQFVVDADGKWPADAKILNFKFTFTTGTGKFAGISGSGTGTCNGPEFRTAAEGTYAQHCALSGSYKLPWP